jgi:hypothetical protein
MDKVLLLLALLAVIVGGCSVTMGHLSPTIDKATMMMVEEQTKADPMEDIVRFRESERNGRSSSILLPFLGLVTIAAFVLLLATPLPRILKETRLLKKELKRKGGGNAGKPLVVPQQPWIEEPATVPQLPAPKETGWLE